MKFDPKEMDNIEVREPVAGLAFTYYLKYDSPISARENYSRCLQHRGEWLPMQMDSYYFMPRVIPDNIARASILEATKYDGPKGGKDMFGIDWEFVPAANGSIVRPGNPTISDISQWEKIVKFPNMNEWDWKGSAEENKDYLENHTRYQNMCVFTGWFERLIAFMDFGPAAFALMNKKTQPYVKEFFDALTDHWIKFVDYSVKAYGRGIDGFTFHDDWGAQHSPFFNKRVVDEMIVPYMKKVTDHIHDLGLTCTQHSCGKLGPLVQSIEAAGWDAWEGMAINDFSSLYPETSLLMTVAAPSELANSSLEQTLRIANDYVDKYANREHPVAISYNTPQNDDFYKEVYKLSRIKMGE